MKGKGEGWVGKGGMECWAVFTRGPLMTFCHLPFFPQSLLLHVPDPPCLAPLPTPTQWLIVFGLSGRVFDYRGENHFLPVNIFLPIFGAAWTSCTVVDPFPCLADYSPVRPRSRGKHLLGVQGCSKCQPISSDCQA